MCEFLNKVKETVSKIFVNTTHFFFKREEDKRDKDAENDRRTGRRIESVVEKQTSIDISNIESCDDRTVCIDDMEISHGRDQIGIAGRRRSQRKYGTRVSTR